MAKTQDPLDRLLQKVDELLGPVEEWNAADIDELLAQSGIDIDDVTRRLYDRASDLVEAYLIRNENVPAHLADFLRQTRHPDLPTADLEIARKMARKPLKTPDAGFVFLNSGALRALRCEKYRTQAALARKIDLDPDTIGQAEAGRRVRHREAIDIADALGVGLKGLLPPTDRGGAMYSPRSVHSFLPRQPYFFGREKELAMIEEAISPEARNWGALIYGPAGIGKTALAVCAGHRAEHFQKIFLSAKQRELTPAGEEKLRDFRLVSFVDLLTELARRLGEKSLEHISPNKRANYVQLALADVRALIILDSVEAFAEPERVRLYQFLFHLPDTCKAIVTSRRRRDDTGACMLRLDPLEREAAINLIAALAKDNYHLQKASEKERSDLYEITNGNPELIKWTVGQLGREGSKCHTVPEACAFLSAAPKGNDPLEYIFGDWLDTFTESETAVLAALAHFTQPVKVECIAEVAGIAKQTALTALEDLTHRALLGVPYLKSQEFFLPRNAATFLRHRCPESLDQSGSRLTSRAYALVLANGFRRFDRFDALEAEWPLVAAALPLFEQRENDQLQTVCWALRDFLHFSGRWDELLAMHQKAEEKAQAAGDLHQAGWRAYGAGWIHYLRRQARETLDQAAQCAAYWREAGAGAREKAFAIRLRGLGHRLETDYVAATSAFQEALKLFRGIAPESADVVLVLYDLAELARLQGEYATAERGFREALRVAKRTDDREGVADCTGSLAELALNRGKWAVAESLARQALDAAEQITRLEFIGMNCSVLAKALARQNRQEEGMPYARRAVEIFAQLPQPDHMERALAALNECAVGAAGS